MKINKLKKNKNKNLKSHLTCSAVSGGEQKFWTTNPRKKSIKFCSMARKYLLLLCARHPPELFTYFNFVWWTSSEFFLISVFVFKSFPLLSLYWTRWHVRSASRQEKWQIQGLWWDWLLSTVYVPWLNDRISWRDTIWNFCALWNSWA